jgi:cyanophycin synthetase
VDNKIEGVLRRDQPHVTGDGAHTVKQLLEIENRNPIRHGPIFSPLIAERDADAELERQGLDWESIPQNGRRVELNQKVNWSAGGSTEDVTDIVHPDNWRLFEEIGAFLNDPLVGMDFIIGDISRSWKDQSRCGTIELNTAPFIDSHHYPFKGKVRDVAGKLWEVVFRKK